MYRLKVLHVVFYGPRLFNAKVSNKSATYESRNDQLFFLHGSNRDIDLDGDNDITPARRV